MGGELERGVRGEAGLDDGGEDSRWCHAKHGLCAKRCPQPGMHSRMQSWSRLGKLNLWIRILVSVGVLEPSPMGTKGWMYKSALLEYFT